MRPCWILWLLLLPLTSSYDWEDWDHYKLLGLKRKATVDKATLKQHYKRRAKEWHPDKHVDETEEYTQKFAKLKEAYDALSDPEQKQAYDETLEDEPPIWRKLIPKWWVVDPEILATIPSWNVEEWLLERLGLSCKPETLTYREEYSDVWNDRFARTTTTQVEQDCHRTVSIQEFAWDYWSSEWVLLGVEPEIVKQGYDPDAVLWSRLQRGEVLVQGRYRAFVTDYCELVILEDGKVLWYLGDALWVTDCALVLEGSTLALVRDRSVAWSSTGGSPFEDAIARLDTDGALSVYRAYVMDRPALFPTLLRRAFAWYRVGQTWLQLECVWSTSPFGCNRIGRLLWRVWRGLRRWLEW